ncbi:ribosomal-processing cysteine protease Prp [Anaerococcus sp. AGMB00486]|uniref:Ribosomal processing cysteine protease Prp n=2 Tax=Anaerococcus TaxID=165779 RepID=A0ABX2N7G0_9FIRM|nr:MULTISPECIES: ribosomal-processing cysteine protease Prp [Anaerococcus]MDY3005466.1 ribosomal-processing cysteine protease Prp [Anaerococcus porci]MSS76894.1 ribosomal-processing cysteine protease Prp [Anaerococcus porci]NVF10622.1 ribosomal-processing cysteine protease Prp [Anaerococcus faecalis]
MIDVTLLLKNKKKIGFKIQGHANFDEHGFDIVCAAVSTLAYTCINSLDFYNYNLEFHDDNDIMCVVVKKASSQSNVILQTFEIGIKTLLTNYSEYIKLNYEEV